MAGRSLKGVIHTCAAKRRFATLDDAEKAARPGLSFYRCVACNGYHLTSQGADTVGSSPSEEMKPTYETSVMGRAKGVRKKPSDSEKSEVAAVCTLKAKPNGIVRVRIGKIEMDTTEPVQPAQLRSAILVGTKLRVEYRESPRLVRVIRLA